MLDILQLTDLEMRSRGIAKYKTQPVQIEVTSPYMILPINKYIYEHLADLTMDDLVACQQKWVKGRTYIYGLLGDASGMDMDFLRTLGPVRQISLDEIFGF